MLIAMTSWRHRTCVVGAPLVKGHHVECSILDIDLIECCVILSRNTVLSSSSATVATVATPRRSGRNKLKVPVIAEVGLSSGSPLVGVVEHKTPYYLVLSCATLAGHKLAYGLMDTVSQRTIIMAVSIFEGGATI